jgi:hypothetical protein
MEHVLRSVEVIPTCLVTVSLFPSANQYTLTVEGSDHNKTVEEDNADAKMIGSRFNICSTWVN